MRPTFVPILVLCALCTPLSAQAPARPGLALESFAPPDVLAFASFAGLQECSRACTGLGLYRLWQEPEVQAFLQGTLESLARASEASPPGALEQWRLGKELLGGRVALILGGLNLAWTRNGPLPIPGVVLALDLGEKRPAFHQAIERLRSPGALGSVGRGFEQETLIHKGREVCVLRRPRSAPHLSLCFTYAENLVLFGLNETLFFRCLDNLESGGESLAGLPAFRRSRAKAAGDPLLELFVHLDALAGRVKGLLPDEWLAALHALGLDGIHGLYYASSVAAGETLETLYLDAPAPRRGLLDLSPRPIGPETLAFVPRDASLFEAVHVDLGAAWDTVMGVLPGLLPPPVHSGLVRRLERLEQRLGFTLRSGLLGAFGTEAVYYLHLKPNALVPEMVLALEVKDREKCEKALAVLAEHLRLQVRAVPFRGQTMHLIGLPGQAPVSPAAAFLGGRLVFSLTPTGLKQAIARHANPGESIQDSPAFQEAFRGLGLPAAHGVQFLDTRQAVELLYGLAETFLPGFSGHTPLPLDFSLLPSREVVAGHAPAFCSGAAGDADGILVRGRTLGAATLLALLARLIDQAPGVPPMTLERLFSPRAAADAPPRTAGAVNPLPQGDPGEAQQERTVEALTRALAARADDPRLLFARGHALHRLRRFAPAAADMERCHALGFQAPQAAYNAACCHALQGEKDRAFHWLATALDAGFEDRALLESDADLAALRADPRWAALMARRN